MDNYKTRVAVYLRKSRADDQNEPIEETLQRHEGILTEYALKNNISVIRTYKEVVSGDGLFTRPQMIALLNDIEQGLYTAVMCVDIDRLGRSSSKDSGIIMETLKDNGCYIITPEKVYDLDNDIDEMTVELKTFFARQELKSIRKRLRRGTEEALKQGAHTGAIPYGYERTKIGKLSTLKINESEASIVRSIFDWYTEDGIGTYVISHQLNAMGLKTSRGMDWSRNTVRTTLKNPVYKGMIVWNRTKWIKKKSEDDKIRIKNNNPDEWITAKGLHEAIVSEEQWQKAQDIMKHRTVATRFTGEVRNQYSGLVYCAKCGKPIQRYHDHHNRCDRLLCTTKSCMPSIKLETFDEAIRVQVEKMLETLKINQKEQPDLREIHLQKRIEIIDNQLTATAAQRSRLHDFLEQGVYSVETFMQRQSILKEKENSLQAEKEKLQREFAGIVKKPISEIIPTMEYLLDNWTTIDSGDKNRVLKELITRITYNREGSNPKNLYFNAEITWRF